MPEYGKRLLAGHDIAESGPTVKMSPYSRLSSTVETDDETIANGAGAVLLILLKSLRPP